MQPMQDSELEQLQEAICEALTTLSKQSETYGGRARIRFFAVGAYLRERGILEQLDLAGAYLMEDPEQGPSENPHV
jgi:hypothetical protein